MYCIVCENECKKATFGVYGVWFCSDMCFAKYYNEIILGIKVFKKFSF